VKRLRIRLQCSAREPVSASCLPTHHLHPSKTYNMTLGKLTLHCTSTPCKPQLLPSHKSTYQAICVAQHPSFPSPSPSSLPSFPIPTCRAKHLLATTPHCHHTPVNTITSQRYSTAIKPTTLATTSLAYHYLQRPRTPLSTHCPPHTSYFYRQGRLP
jgi:hypothetical protein